MPATRAMPPKTSTSVLAVLPRSTSSFTLGPHGCDAYFGHLLSTCESADERTNTNATAPIAAAPATPRPMKPNVRAVAPVSRSAVRSPSGPLTPLPNSELPSPSFFTTTSAGRRVTASFTDFFSPAPSVTDCSAGVLPPSTLIAYVPGSRSSSVPTSVRSSGSPPIVIVRPSVALPSSFASPSASTSTTVSFETLGARRAAAAAASASQPSYFVSLTVMTARLSSSQSRRDDA